MQMACIIMLGNTFTFQNGILEGFPATTENFYTVSSMKGMVFFFSSLDSQHL